MPGLTYAEYSLPHCLSTDRLNTMRSILEDPLPSDSAPTFHLVAQETNPRGMGLHIRG